MIITEAETFIKGNRCESSGEFQRLKVTTLPNLSIQNGSDPCVDG